jgi:proteasome beta subunit
MTACIGHLNIWSNCTTQRPGHKRWDRAERRLQSIYRSSPSILSQTRNFSVHDRADKVLEIDRHSVMAIAGSPAIAQEMARILEHSFQFYRRCQLHEMSVEGKVRALSKLLRDNLGMVMQGVGVVVPLFATYDKKSSGEAKVFFYDAMGAQFEATDFASSGSGALAVRSVLYYENNWGSKPLRERNREESILLALKALDTAAEADTATGGVDRHGTIFPNNQDCD